MEEAVSCKICDTRTEGNLLIYCDEFWQIRHSNETNIIGYCILEPRRHFLDLSEASNDELAAYGPLLSRVMNLQRKLLKCERVYTFSLAEAVPHFHVHLIPRAKNFPREFVGRGIMSYPTTPGPDSGLAATIVTRFKSEFGTITASNMESLNAIKLELGYADLNAPPLKRTKPKQQDHGGSSIV